MVDNTPFMDDDNKMRFPGEPLWFSRMAEAAEATEEKLDTPESIKQMVEMLEQIKQRVMAGEIAGLFVCAETTDDGFSFTHTVSDNVFARYGAVVGYCNRLVAHQLDACAEEQR